VTRTEKTKLSNKEKAKTIQPMSNVIQLEDRVSRSRSKHEGESSASVCDRLSRIRVSSQRQLPTDHDYAVPTCEYQLDQSSPLPASMLLILSSKGQKLPLRFEDVDRVTPYQLTGWPSIRNPVREWIGQSSAVFERDQDTIRIEPDAPK
jgi:hypothetical protein